MSDPVRAVVFDIEQLDFTKSGGLVTIVTQDATTGAVLMVAHADREALEHTLRSGEMHYRSRSRGLWHKGGTSGNTQRVVSLTADCDADAVLARVVPAGPACHNGTTSRSPRACNAPTTRPRATRNDCLATATFDSRNSAKKRSSWRPLAWTATLNERPKRPQICSITRWWPCAPWVARSMVFAPFFRRGQSRLSFRGHALQRAIQKLRCPS